MAKNFNKMTIDPSKGRVMAGEELGLTGCEVSFNYSPAGQFTPFVHAHKQNEETYIIIEGDGQFMVDGEEFAIAKNDVIKIVPDGARAIKAGDRGMSYICIQAKSGSLEQATGDDGVMCETPKPSWM